MSRTKGAKGKHHKEKPHKEKKQRGRPKGSIKQKQSQKVTININNGGGGGNSNNRSSIPAQLPLTVFNPSLIQPDYGINDRQPVNPLTDASPDLLTPFLQAMTANMQHTQQPSKPQPNKPQPIIPVTQPTKESTKEPKPEIIKPPQQPPPHHFTHEDVQKYIEKNKIVQVPQNKQEPVDKGLVENIVGAIGDSANKLVSKPKDKYDGLKMKNKTMPLGSVIKGAVSGTIMGATAGLAGPALINNAVVGASSAVGGLIGYQLDGNNGAMNGSMLGGLIGASSIDKFHKAYPDRKKRNIAAEREGYEEIPNGSLVNGGTVIATGRTTGRTTASKKSDTKPLHNRLFDAIKEVNTTPASSSEVKERVKQSRILKDFEQRQKQMTSNDKPSTLENLTEGVKRIYRRLSGKGEYSKVPTHDDDEFETVTRRKQKKGTYAILPTDEPSIDIEKELDKMQKKTPTKSSPPKESPVSKEWSAIKRFGERNERSIRESVERVDKEERKNQDINQQVRELLGIDHEPSYNLARTTQQPKKTDVAMIKPQINRATTLAAPTQQTQLNRREIKRATETRAVNKLIKALNDKKIRIEAKHELHKRRVDFNEDRESNIEQYQKLLRINKKKADDQISESKTRMNEPFTEAQSRRISKAYKIRASYPLLSEKVKLGRPPKQDDPKKGKK